MAGTWDSGVLSASSLFDQGPTTARANYGGGGGGVGEEFPPYGSPRESFAAHSPATTTQHQHHGPYTLRLPTQPYAASADHASASGATTYHSAHTAAASSNSNSNPNSSSSTGARFCYKLVAKCGPAKLVSIYDGRTEYVLGQTVRKAIRIKANGGARRQQDDAHAQADQQQQQQQQPQQQPSQSWTSRKIKDETQGGIFVCRTAEEALAARIPDEAALFCAPRALLKVLCYGSSIEYAGGTVAFECCRPVQVFPLSLDYQCTPFGEKTRVAVHLRETRQRLPAFHGPRRHLLRTYREREEIGRITRDIMDQERTLTRITRAQLGAGTAPNTARTATSTSSSTSAR